MVNIIEPITEMSNLESDYNGHNRNLLSIFSTQFTCAITVKPQNMGHVYGRLLCTKINFKTLSSFRSESSLMFIVLLRVTCDVVLFHWWSLYHVTIHGLEMTELWNIIFLKCCRIAT